MQKADTLIVIGTSLRVNPAAWLINLFKGSNFIIINLSSTPYDGYASLLINDKSNITNITAPITKLYIIPYR
jgi:NAD-dependent deacetylase